ncbi:alpha/beta hydrolase [soil metagenome]
MADVPGAPWPDRAEVRFIDRPGGVRLRTAFFPAGDGARGTVVLSPGRTEPFEKYAEVVGELHARGFAVLAHDWRGQGGSTRLGADALSGHATGWRPFVQDYRTVLDAWELLAPKPWIAVGHSMCGGLTALILSEGEPRIAGAVLSAPMLGVTTGQRSPTEVGWVAFAMGLVGRGRGLPLPQSDPLKDAFENQALTHDRARWARTQALITAHPELRLGGVTWGWLAFALALCRRMATGDAAARIMVPFAVVAAGDDRLCVSSAARAVADRAPKGRYVEVEDAWHEVLMETDDKRAVFWRVFDETVAGL